jgi:hypothetical protein
MRRGGRSSCTAQRLVDCTMSRSDAARSPAGWDCVLGPLLERPAAGPCEGPVCGNGARDDLKPVASLAASPNTSDDERRRGANGQRGMCSPLTAASGHPEAGSCTGLHDAHRAFSGCQKCHGVAPNGSAVPTAVAV